METLFKFVQTIYQDDVLSAIALVTIAYLCFAIYVGVLSIFLIIQQPLDGTWKQEQ